MFLSPTASLLTTTGERILALILVLIVLVTAGGSQPVPTLSALLAGNISVVKAVITICMLLVWTLAFSKLELNVLHRSSWWMRTKATFRGALFVTACLALLLVFAKEPVQAKTLALTWVISVGLVSSRILIAFVYSSLFCHRTQALILGTGPMARRAWRELRTNHPRSVGIVGFVGDCCLDTAPPEMRSHYLGNISEIEQLILTHVVDTVIVAMPAKSCYGSIQRAIAVAEQVGVDVLQFEGVYRRKEQLEDLLARFTPNPRHQLPHLSAQIIKRCFDFMGSLIALLLLSPLFLLIAIAIKVAGKGPVFFKQDRFGFRRRKFKLLKFRTMVENAEALMKDIEHQNEANGPIFKMQHDPRVTPIGRMLRRTSLDELPQLWNVLLGDMSLVGPRPMSVRDVSLFDRCFLMRRFIVRPGITGLWQVSGRSSTSFEQWMALDFHYIDRWSLLLDLQILLKTVPAVLTGSGAM